MAENLISKRAKQSFPTMGINTFLINAASDPLVLF